MGADLLDVARGVLAGARHGEQVEVYAVRSRSTTVRAHAGAVESLTVAETAGVGVRVVDASRRLGVAWAGTLDEEAVSLLVEEARDNASVSEPDEWNALARPDGVVPPDLDLVSPSLVSMTTDAKVERALALERATVGADSRVYAVRAAIWSDSLSERALVSTEGIEAAGRSGSCSMNVQALARHAGDTRSASGFTIARDPGSLDVEAAAGEASSHATRLLGAVKPRSARVAIVLEPAVASSVMAIVGATLSGEAVLKGRSLFAGRLGEMIASPCVTLVDDPTDVRDAGAAATGAAESPAAGLGGLPHDGEGLASRRNVLIAAGRLAMFVHDSHTGRRAGAASTGSAVRGSLGATPSPGCRALSLVPGSRSLDEIVSGIDDGVLVQALTGLNSGVNRVSGDVSVGIAGLRIRDGSLAEPVKEATIASTIPRLLQSVLEVGGDVRVMGAGTAVTLAIGDVSLSGT